MTDVIQLVSAYPSPPVAKVKQQSLLLAPFFNAVIVYFAFVRDGMQVEVSTVLKCAPIVFLMLYILLKGFAFSKSYKCSVLVLFGLLFSCGGDALLNVDLFPHGMASFGVAHLFYISAFGWKPIKWPIGIGLYVCGGIIVGVLFKYLEGVLVYGVPIYGALLLAMCWRATAKAVHRKDALSIFCAIGSFLFVFSDSLIVLNMFLIDMAFSRVWIMVTYYTAQLAIALSTAPENKFAKAKKVSNSSSSNNKRRGKSKD